MNPKTPTGRAVRGMRGATRKHHVAEDKICNVLESLGGEESIAALCRREGIAGARATAGSRSRSLRRHKH